MGWTGFTGKTLWDWLQLFAALAVPLALGLATIWFNVSQADLAQQQHDIDQTKTRDQQRETALQSYLDHMSGLILGENMGETSPSSGSAQSNSEISTVAQAQTLAVLSNLDERRKGVVLQFLHNAHLIGNTSSSPATVDLHGANLIGVNLNRGADLSGANLSGANLSSAHLSGINLSGANLSSAEMTGTDMSDADMRGTNLSESDLKGANLRGANLSAADFNIGTDLSKANLSGANLSEGQLAGAILEKADLSGAELWKANLLQANLGEATLDGADLREASLGNGTYLDKASYTERTNWPAHMNPEKVGAHKTPVRRLPAFVDFGISSSHPHLANATLKTNNLRLGGPDNYGQYYARLDIKDKVVLEFDLEESDLTKTVVTVKGLITQISPSQAGYSPISLQLNGHPAFVPNYIMPGGGFRMIPRSFHARAEQLTSGPNTLTLTIAPHSSTVFWLYRLEVGLESP